MNHLQAHVRLGAIHKELAIAYDPKVIIQLLDEAVRCCTTMSDQVSVANGAAISELRQAQLEANQGEQPCTLI